MLPSQHPLPQIHLLASASGHRGPAYFFTVGSVLLLFGLVTIISPAAVINFNAWLAKSAVIRALARARSGTDEADPNPVRIRVVGALATVLGVAALIWGITHS